MISPELQKLIQNFFKEKFKKRKFISGQTKIPIASPPYGAEEVVDALESMLSTWVSMGKKVGVFEQQFSDYIGCKYGVMVNSGSSANLLALSVLTNPLLKERIKKNSLIITPAVTWATTVFPIFNVGCKPLFVDVDLETFCVNVDSIKDAISPEAECIMPVHLMGYPCEMNEISKIAKKEGLYVVEDSCEAHGAAINGKKVGSFGDIGTFSFFMSHHITTIEGGMIVTNNEELYEISKSLRAFGWSRELKNKDEINAKNPEIDPRFLFVNLGFNIRPSEIQGAFGINQLKKLDKFIEIRRENAKYWNERLEKYSDYLILPNKNVEQHVFFGYPITIRKNAPFNREKLTKFLESKKIETRPIMAGNFVEQPVSKLFDWKKFGNLENSKLIMRNSFFIGNHQDIKDAEREYVANMFEQFLKENI